MSAEPLGFVKKWGGKAAIADLTWRGLYARTYGPKDYGGRRGGDLIIDIDPTDASIKNVLWGQ